MRRKTIRGLVAFLLLAPTAASAQTLDQEMAILASKISKALMSQGFKSVAAVDFTDLQGRPTELGRFLADQLSVEIVSSGGVSMVDRANIRSILAEHKLTEEGLVNPANAKKLGEFAGVDAILTGTITALDASIVLTVKAVATATARLAAAGKATFAKTSEIQQLLNRSVAGPGSLTTSSPEGTGPRHEVANAIATKDYGPLRVVLKSVMPVKVATAYQGQTASGIRVVFEFLNRDIQNAILVAANAEPPITNRFRGGTELIPLRSSLLDERGDAWSLSALRGLSVIRAGVHGQAGIEAYSATDIVRLLQLYDKLGRNTDDPSDKEERGGYCAYAAACPSTSVPNKGNRFLSGSTTTIEPGQSATVTMEFTLTGSGSGTPPASVQINTEIVVGLTSASKKPSYTLQNMTFDRVSVSGF